MNAPKLAFGTGTKWFRRSDASSDSDAVNHELVASIVTALRAGFTHIDTAEMYNTEIEVGLALAQHMRETGLKRDHFYITTKVSAPPADIPKSMARSLANMGPALEGYVDLYLIHSPFWDYTETSELSMSKVWGQMQSLVTDTKQARAIGVSNWRQQDFDAVLATKPVILPAVNQIEFHAYIQNPALQEYMARHGVRTAAYGPLQPLIKFAESGPVKTVVDRIAEAKGAGVTGSQVLLAWGFAQGSIQVTTSAKEERVREAVAALSVELTASEVEEISAAGRGLELRKFWVGQKF
ncbi:ketoreductase [Chytriomyces cf. hyalinus JEL632]|nr:ketoreductase [Chytriomyces cf. hyalinus JEL632]